MINLTSGLTNNSGGDSFCPDVPENVTTYNIVNNDFRSVDLNEITSGNVQVAKTDSSRWFIICFYRVTFKWILLI